MPICGEARRPPRRADAHADESGGENGEPRRVARQRQWRGQREEEAVESVGGADALEEVQERVPRFRRQYKIQEVIKRRQVMLVQVVKEERGSKGAALTTYLSLAGRYSVLMPNTARGGGICRKITSGEDRSRLKEIAQELEVPEGMGVILRTAGACAHQDRGQARLRISAAACGRRCAISRCNRPRPSSSTRKARSPSVRSATSTTRTSTRSSSPATAAYKDAKDFMRMLMPSHAKHVKPYKDTQPLFTRYGVESQLDAMFYAGGAVALRRLHRHQPGGSAGGDRRQLGPRHARTPHRGHRAQDQ